MCPLCGVSQTDCVGRGAVRLLQSLVHELQEKLTDRDATIKHLHAELAAAQADTNHVTTPSYSGQRAVTFVQQPVSIEIEGTRDVGHTEYRIAVTMNDGECFHAWRRYKDFASLHKELAGAGFSLPSLPRKHIFTSATATVIREREEGLRSFMHALILEPDTLHQPTTEAFFGLSTLSRNHNSPPHRSPAGASPSNTRCM